MAVDTLFYLSLLQVRANISDDDTYENGTVSSLVTALGNTNTPLGGSTGNTAQGGDPVNTLVSSVDTGIIPAIVHNSSGVATFRPGLYRIEWIDGVFSPGVGAWKFGTFIVNGSVGGAIQFTFGDENVFATEAIAKAYAAFYSGFVPAPFEVLKTCSIQIENLDYDPGNTDGTPLSTFKIVPVMGLPLTYSTDQNGIAN